MDNAKMPKNAVKFICDICDFKCSKYSNYICHLKTKKHAQSAKDNQMIIDDNDFVPKNADYICACGSIYKYMSGLCRHKKKCKKEKEEHQQSFNFITPELVMELIKDNKDMKQIILEQNNTITKLVNNGTTNINNSLNNNNNKTFNLQFFLNETCKDAMNITDFVNSIKLQLSDLENVGELGYVQGITDIITSNLQALDITQRPVHCTDKKRETMYVKDEDKWEKEDEHNTKMRNVVKSVSNKNIRLLSKFKEKYPGYNDAESPHSDKYSKTVIEAMGGAGNNDMEKENKIIHNISKCITIDKTPN